MNRLEQTLDVGSADLFPVAREAILTWKLQESAGMVARPARRVHVGQIGDLRLNPVYRTLPGHLESGEQTFLVSVGADERLTVSIMSESVPRHPTAESLCVHVGRSTEDDGHTLCRGHAADTSAVGPPFAIGSLSVG